MAKEEKKPTAPKAAVQKKPDKKPGLFKKIAKWFREMRSELKKVIWPTPKQLLNNTIVALVVMAVFAIVIWAFDQLAGAAIQALITITG